MNLVELIQLIVLCISLVGIVIAIITSILSLRLQKKEVVGQNKKMIELLTEIRNLLRGKK